MAVQSCCKVPVQYQKKTDDVAVGYRAAITNHSNFSEQAQEYAWAAMESQLVAESLYDTEAKTSFINPTEQKMRSMQYSAKLRA